MNAEVVCVGTELLLGDIVNGNAAEIGRMLAENGIACYRSTAVGDNESRIAEAVSDALDRADAVIVTGGLGPTQDDVTREAIARLSGGQLIRDDRMAEVIRARFSRLKRHMPEVNLRQADRPADATPIEPRMGTAPGLIVERGGKPIYLIPGVPSEMREMMDRAVLPDLRRRSGGEAHAIATRVIRVTGMAESAVAEALASLWESLERSGVNLSFLAGGGEVRVRLTAKAGIEAVTRAEASVRAALGDAVVGVDEETLERVVHALLADRGWTIACAESLTGGLLGARLVDVPGASLRFKGSAVVYVDEAKRELLGVEPAPGGAVSAETATAMARGARDRFHVDLALSTTGVAGPGPQDGVDAGTVFVAVSGPLGDACREVHLPGDRATVRGMAVASALNLVRLYLLEALP